MFFSGFDFYYIKIFDWSRQILAHLSLLHDCKTLQCHYRKMTIGNNHFVLLVSYVVDRIMNTLFKLFDVSDSQVKSPMESLEKLLDKVIKERNTQKP